MMEPREETDRGSRLQLLAIVLVTLLVMVLGVLVVAPDRMGVPQRVATPVATPAESDGVMGDG